MILLLISDALNIVSGIYLSQWPPICCTQRFWTEEGLKISWHRAGPNSLTYFAVMRCHEIFSSPSDGVSANSLIVLNTLDESRYQNLGLQGAQNSLARDSHSSSGLFPYFPVTYSNRSWHFWDDPVGRSMWLSSTKWSNSFLVSFHHSTVLFFLSLRATTPVCLCSLSHSCVKLSSAAHV